MMRVPLFTLLLWALLLSGCGSQNLPATEPSGSAEPAPTASSALFITADEETGALRTHLLTHTVSGFLSTNRGLLFFEDGDTTTLTLVDPDSGEPLASHNTGMVLTPENFTVQKLAQGLSYYHSGLSETVVLDETLTVLRRIPAPEGLTGAPLLSQDGKVLYFCTADSLRALDLTTGLSRMVKESSYPVQGVCGLLAEDSVIQLQITDWDGSMGTLFLAADTGRLLREAPELLLPQTAGTFYFLPLNQGILLGHADTAPMLLQPRLAQTDACFLPDSLSAVTSGIPEGNTLLERYDLASGLRTASVSLPGIHTIQSMQEARDGMVWILTQQAETGSQCLYRWDSSRSSLSDSTCYLHAYHTPEEPDYEGLAACSLRAKEIGQRYGLEVLIYREAVSQEPWDYHLVAEHQVSILNRELEALDRNLSRFPAEFWDILAHTYTALKICLVRTAESQSQTAPETVSGIQFLDGYDAYIALCCGQDTERALYHELCHLMETVILTESIAFDRWDNLNPQGFQYGRSPDREWLQPGREWFVDEYAMSAAKEDRARIFEYAMTSGNAERFQSPPLQDKLRQLCSGIREAFGLKAYQGSLPWEQYLHTP